MYMMAIIFTSDRALLCTLYTNYADAKAYTLQLNYVECEPFIRVCAFLSFFV